MAHVAIIGCGDVGTRVGIQLIEAGHTVLGVRRNVAKLPAEFKKIAADVTDLNSLRPLTHTPPDIVIYALAASHFSEDAYKAAYVTGVHHTLTALAPGINNLHRFIFVSSSSVYHQHKHERVDEVSATHPERFSGRRILEGETTALSSAVATIVRFSGIYGPDRLRLINKVRQGSISPIDPLRFTNRIHIEDCASILTWIVERAIAKQSLQSHYLASDCAATSAHEVDTFIAAKLNVAATDKTTAQSQRNPGSKRCVNSRLIKEGYRFRYPTYKEGYGNILDDLGRLN